MQTGKLAGAVLKRSVLRPLAGDNGRGGERYGADCAVVEEEEGNLAAYTVVGTVPGSDRCPGMLVTAAVNNLAAAGAVPRELLLHAVLPCAYDEKALQEDMRQIAAQARKHHMAVIGGHTEVSETAVCPLYSAVGVGRAGREDCRADELLRPGQELLVTKWIALAGTAAVAGTYGEELYRRYPAPLIDSAKGFGEMMCVLDEARIAVRHGRCAMHDLSQGGIFGALWEMAERAGAGLEIDLKKIPIRQETVEICEFFDINPYCLYSAGSLLIGTEQGGALAETLRAAGIPAAVIGRVTPGRERIVRNGEDVRYLDRPKQDEWYRRFGA